MCNGLSLLRVTGRMFNWLLRCSLLGMPDMMLLLQLVEEVLLLLSLQCFCVTLRFMWTNPVALVLLMNLSLLLVMFLSISRRLGLQ